MSTSSKFEICIMYVHLSHLHQSSRGYITFVLLIIGTFLMGLGPKSIFCDKENHEIVKSEYI
jgi:hypothetical protein